MGLKIGSSFHFFDFFRLQKMATLRKSLVPATLLVALAHGWELQNECHDESRWESLKRNPVDSEDHCWLVTGHEDQFVVGRQMYTGEEADKEETDALRDGLKKVESEVKRKFEDGFLAKTFGDHLCDRAGAIAAGKAALLNLVPGIVPRTVKQAHTWVIIGIVIGALAFVCFFGAGVGYSVLETKNPVCGIGGFCV